MRDLPRYSLWILYILIMSFPIHSISNGDDKYMLHHKSFALRVKSIEVFNEAENLIDNCMVSSGSYSGSFGVIGISKKARVTYTLPSSQPILNSDVTIEWDSNENKHYKVTVNIENIIKPSSKPAEILFTIKKDGTVITQPQN